MFISTDEFACSLLGIQEENWPLINVRSYPWTWSSFLSIFFCPLIFWVMNCMHVDYVHILLDLLLDIALFINVSSNSIFSYPQIPLVYFLLCLRVELLLLILYSARVELSPASIFLSSQVSYKDNHITYEHSFLSFFLSGLDSSNCFTVLFRTSWQPGDQCRRRQLCFVLGLGEEALRVWIINVMFAMGLFCFCFFCIFPFVNWGCSLSIPNTPSFKTSWIGVGSTCMTLWLSLWCSGLLLWGLNVELLCILSVRGMLLESYLHLFLGKRSLMSCSVAI